MSELSQSYNSNCVSLKGTDYSAARELAKISWQTSFVSYSRKREFLCDITGHESTAG